MSIVWPSSLVQELADRRCIIVMGAGVSAACKSRDQTKMLPDWSGLLAKLNGKLRDSSEQVFISDLIDKGKYLEAAQIIRDRINSADFAALVRAEFVSPCFFPSELHKVIHEIDCKVVITTNYDNIYETYCLSESSDQGYNVCKYYDTHLLNDIRSTTRIIIKAHGCISDPTKLVLTKSSYFEARRDYPQFYAILDSLFLTSTLLFVGCSLSDPDIQLVLENSNISAKTDHRHYSLMPSGTHYSLKKAILSTYNIELIEYPAHDHSLASVSLRELCDMVIAHRLGG